MKEQEMIMLYIVACLFVAFTITDNIISSILLYY